MVILLVALISIGAGGWLLYTRYLPLAGHESTAAATEAPRSQEGPTIVALEPFLVNLADPASKRYLRIAFDIEVSSPLGAEEMKKKGSQIRDSILLVVTSKSFDDIRPAAGKGQLREEILAEINKVLEHGKARKVYFKEFVVQ